MKLHIAWLVMGMLALASCERSTSNNASTQPAASSGQKLQIAVIPKGTTHEFWKSIHAGAQKAADELGVQIIWKGPQLENDREGQVRVVEDFVGRKVSGIVLAPLDDT